jgi:pimeloyl-ACP methyl ester carboxylesterase
MTGALASFLDAVHLRRTALVGNSWSGGWALSFAQRYPQRVSRLALLDSSGLDVPDIWTWRVFKIPVVGELLADFDVTKGSMRSFLDMAIWQAGQLGRALPRASVHVLSGCGHLLELDCPSQTDRYLAGFLAPG